MRSAAKYIWLVVAVFFIVGFLLLETSGLLGGTAGVTPSTVVGRVNGEEITYAQWDNSYRELSEGRRRQSSAPLSLDDDQALRDQAFEQIVNDLLLRQEYTRRGIRVSDAEIIQAAQSLPPRELMQNPDFQTEGQFDPAKYQRFLTSPVARQQGALAYLENYYRNELPRLKLYDQIAAGVYVTDAQLWRLFQDQNDSAQVTLVRLGTETVPDSAVTVSDDEVRAYFERHREAFRRPGRAVVSVVTLPRVVTAADSAATRSRLAALREDIVAGRRSFEDVAKAESSDSGSAVNGGLLPPSTRGRFVREFDDAAFALRKGEISSPVLTQFGVHLIKLEDRKGDTVTLRHILLPIRQSDSSATVTDRRADELARIAGAESAQRFDSAARAMGLRALQLQAVEGQPLNAGGRQIPSVSAWAFGGAIPGEISDLYDSEDAYFIARLDSLQLGGEPTLDRARDEIRDYLRSMKKAESLLPAAQQLAQEAARTSLESAASARGLRTVTTPLFTRISGAAVIGRLNPAVGAAFALPVGAIGEPVKTMDGVFVIRVDRKVPADRAAFEAQKALVKPNLVQQLRQQQVQAFLEGLRREADIEDNRREINAAARRLDVES